jgi:hypothetical protein
MIDRLLEIGEIGLLKDIPAEIDILTNENVSLKTRNARQKSELRFWHIVVAAIVIYFFWKDFQKWIPKKTEDESINT